ncbi:hypothetical protein Glove_360g78 [Diversispora epigaea]|uniref:Uncharacterized protein n=1 Tax=Diversispora epigaea TaxID=1348612 RepID=A0A397H9T5_9GLOM|nr:hypothetical protein Glove_360g78 [Diversispora epigaea]
MLRYSSVQEPLSAPILSTFGSGTDSQMQKGTQEKVMERRDIEAQQPFFSQLSSRGNTPQNLETKKFSKANHKPKKKYSRYFLDEENDPTYVCWFTLFCSAIIIIVIVGISIVFAVGNHSDGSNYLSPRNCPLSDTFPCNEGYHICMKFENLCLSYHCHPSAYDCWTLSFYKR